MRKIIIGLEKKSFASNKCREFMHTFIAPNKNWPFKRIIKNKCVKKHEDFFKKNFLFEIKVNLS